MPETRAERRGPEETQVGSVFVSNYPPYSCWKPENLPDVRRTLETPGSPDTPLGLYLHIPFCRRRCKFCYFRVFTDKNSREVERYVGALAREVEILARTPLVRDRPLKFVYFGGGTPSFISARHLRGLAARIGSALPSDAVEEVTFECEPGTLTRAKLEAIREIGVTRLSLGVENFNDDILAENGRAHLSEEIYRVIPWIEALDFDQLNIDLIAGMVRETTETWRDTVRKAADLAPDSVTVYQMELPYNTVYSGRLLEDSAGVPLADWATKRAWHDYAFETLERAGYVASSAYTMVRDEGCRFVYRDSLWHGCDMLGAGVASFSHLGGAHAQNHSGWEPYLTAVEAGELPLERGLLTTPRERMTRELILQLKLGEVRADYFRGKFGTEILQEFGEAFDGLRREKMLAWDGDRVELTREGLLRVDRLLPRFYAPEHRSVRYT